MTERKIRLAPNSSAAISRSAEKHRPSRSGEGIAAASPARSAENAAAPAPLGLAAAPAGNAPGIVSASIPGEAAAKRAPAPISPRILGEIAAGVPGLAVPKPAPTIAVLPLGAHEYHGPHLPLETDTILAAAFAKAIAARLPADSAAQVEFLPAEPVGYSREHMCAKGSETLSYHKAIEKWLAIGEAAYHRGAHKFIMLNAHGGNSPLMTIIATELRDRFNMLAVATSLSRFGLPAGLLSPQQQALDIHGGFIETSLMLAIAPEKVNMAAARNFSNKQAEYERHFSLLRAYGRHAFGWLMGDINPAGAAGLAAEANAAAGEQILAHAAGEAVKLFRDVQKFDLAAFNPPPGRLT